MLIIYKTSKTPNTIPNSNVTISNIKKIINHSRLRTYLKINEDATNMYFELGKELALNIDSNNGLINIVKEASVELINEFGKGEGYGERNLKYCIKFYRETQNDSEVHQLGALVPWKTLCLILDKTKTREEKLFYLNYTLKNNLGRVMLEMHMNQDRFNKEKQLIPSNFDKTISNDSDLINDLISSEVLIETMVLSKNYKEKELENQIIHNIKNFLINLGEGFCYIGNQNSFQYNNEEYITDLLFFNRNLKCLFAIELKIGKFKPEYISKMQWYLHLLDTQMKLPEENRSIGIILCGSKDDYQIKTLLDDISVPIGVATHKLVAKIGKELKKFLPDSDNVMKN